MVSMDDPTENTEQEEHQVDCKHEVSPFKGRENRIIEPQESPSDFASSSDSVMPKPVWASLPKSSAGACPPSLSA